MLRVLSASALLSRGSQLTSPKNLISRPSAATWNSVQSRTFFWSGNGDNGDDSSDEKKDKEKNTNKDPSPKIEKPTISTPDKSSDRERSKESPLHSVNAPKKGDASGVGSSSNDTSRLRKRRLFRVSGSSGENTTADGSGTFVPSRQGFGDESPRYPHLLALPVVHRPIFPGVISNVTLTDPVSDRWRIWCGGYYRLHCAHLSGSEICDQCHIWLHSYDEISFQIPAMVKILGSILLSVTRFVFRPQLSQ